MFKVRNYLVAATAIALLSLGAHAAYAVDPAANCEATKNKESAEYALCLQKAQATFVKRGDAAKLAAAIAKCEASLAASFTKAEARADGACPTTGDAATVKTFMDAQADEMSNYLGGDNGPLPQDVSSCNEDLDTCGDGLTTCTTNLATASGNYASCSSSLTTATGNLASCSAALTSCQTDLGTCAAGTATAADVLDGKTFSSSAGLGLTGTFSSGNCGNGVLDDGEDCELGTMGGGTCVTAGFDTGALVCAPGTCTYDISGCSDFPPSTDIVIYAAPISTNPGSLGSRATTSAICAGAADAQSLSCSNGRIALLAYSGGDDIQSMPSNHGVSSMSPIVAGAGATKIADDWSDFLDGSWDACLGTYCDSGDPAANLPINYGITGAGNNGTVGNNCNDFTSTGGSVSGAYAECNGSGGSSCFGDPLRGFGDLCVNQHTNILCLCY
ncbi:MAG TPA: hypothetical protein VEB21_11295 [Terriglobales bacterium]|nr:hypothetical protein [Terriglobales bacterium]